MVLDSTYNPKYVTLWYRGAGHKQLDAVMSNKPTYTEYYPIVTYPVAEMMGTNIAAIANEFITLTHSVQWRMKIRRPAEHGDIITLHQNVYMLIDPHQPILNQFTTDKPIDELIWQHLKVKQLDMCIEEWRAACSL